MAKIVNYKTYRKKFEEFVRKGVPVKGIKFDKEVSEIIENAADFKQCYDPNFKVRKQLPKYWFISKEGFLVNVKGKKPAWVKPNMDSYRPQFKPSPSLKEWIPGKSITTYDLVALTWGSFISPDAYYLLNTSGAEVLGSNEMDEKKLHKSKVQGHHWNNEYIHEISLESYIKNNDPENIQLITNREHHFLHEMAASGSENFSFYAPKYRNVHSAEPIVYLCGDKPRLARLSDVKIEKILSVREDFLEKDSCVIGDYLFVGTDMRDYFEENMEYLKKISVYFNKDHDGFAEFTSCGTTMYFRYIGK